MPCLSGMRYHTSSLSLPAPLVFFLTYNPRLKNKRKRKKKPPRLARHQIFCQVSTKKMMIQFNNFYINQTSCNKLRFLFMLIVSHSHMTYAIGHSVKTKIKGSICFPISFKRLHPPSVNQDIFIFQYRRLILNFEFIISTFSCIKCLRIQEEKNSNYKVNNIL